MQFATSTLIKLGILEDRQSETVIGNLRRLAYLRMRIHIVDLPTTEWIAYAV